MHCAGQNFLRWPLITHKYLMSSYQADSVGNTHDVFYSAGSMFEPPPGPNNTGSTMGFSVPPTELRSSTFKQTNPTFLLHS